MPVDKDSCLVEPDIVVNGRALTFACPECRGSGTVWKPEWSMPDGRELYMCDECDGSGIIEECDACQDARERDADDAV